jgi:hypothetical protein
VDGNLTSKYIHQQEAMDYRQQLHGAKRVELPLSRSGTNLEATLSNKQAIQD